MDKLANLGAIIHKEAELGLREVLSLLLLLSSPWLLGQHVSSALLAFIELLREVFEHAIVDNVNDLLVLLHLILGLLLVNHVTACDENHLVPVQVDQLG